MRKIKEVYAKNYRHPGIEKGYAGQVLQVDISKGNEWVDVKEVSEETKKIFIGGKGFCLWMLWKLVGDIEDVGWVWPTGWQSERNALCIASGALSGLTTCPGAGKSIVTAISPLTGSVVDSNVGGHFGPFLKFSGFDALSVRGKSENVVVFIDGIKNSVHICEISGFPKDSYRLSEALTKYFGKDKLRNISVITSGPGAKHTLLGCLNFSWFDSKRGRVRYKQAGRGGLGTVFADKGLQAIVVRWDASKLNMNNPENAPLLKELTRRHTRELRELDLKQNEMATVGTTHLVTIMNDYNLLPVKNYQFGQHSEAPNLGAEIYRRLFDKGHDSCWIGCALSCAHGIRDFVPMTGVYKGKKVFVDGPEYETIAGCGSNLGIFDPHFVAEMNFYCDTYGLDTISVGTSIAFVMECFERGLINEKHTGGMKLNFGNKVASLNLLHQMAKGKGFGVIVGRGVRRMKEIFAEHFGASLSLLQDIGMEAKGLEFSEYISKESLAQQGGYGLALKGPQHDEAWLIFLDMVHNFMPTFEQKAEALHWFPMWRTWFSLLGLCKLPWNDVVPEDNKETPEPAKVMKHVGWYAEYFSALTGQKVLPADLIIMSERVYTFQRLFNLKMGFGRRVHDNIPYRAMGPVTVEEYESRREYYDRWLTEKHGVDIAEKNTEEKIIVMRLFREEAYELLKDAVYERRGWTDDGIPTLATVKRLGIDFPDIVELLKKNGVTK